MWQVGSGKRWVNERSAGKRASIIHIWRPQHFRIFWPPPLSLSQISWFCSFHLLFGDPLPPPHCGRHIWKPPIAAQWAFPWAHCCKGHRVFHDFFQTENVHNREFLREMQCKWGNNFQDKLAKIAPYCIGTDHPAKQTHWEHVGQKKREAKQHSRGGRPIMPLLWITLFFMRLNGKAEAACGWEPCWFSNVPTY